MAKLGRRHKESILDRFTVLPLSRESLIRRHVTSEKSGGIAGKVFGVRGYYAFSFVSIYLKGSTLDIASIQRA